MITNSTITHSKRRVPRFILDQITHLQALGQRFFKCYIHIFFIEADYAEWKDGTSSTGLIFSSGSMAQKFGGAFAGWAVMALLALFGYNTTDGAVQTPEALTGLKYLMSFIPAAIALVSLLSVWIYPLNGKKMQKINSELKTQRKAV